MQKCYTVELQKECEDKLGRLLSKDEDQFIKWLADRQQKEDELLMSNNNQKTNQMIEAES
ncbi:hypothetical protein SAMN05192534_108106 [Alteribacillus persepolensis]|uniref:Uncharacterized protein n=1 Tax=Alteribacillus persepolensis TaxID=568899 RepID=A0A1G8E1V8_9BACI|nr:hypothetical protein [Alteribacillus persepolensis]SDH63811.1 hypothetical protein SAMN05192534_108106 [Alteribacillus persepolensis]